LKEFKKGGPEKKRQDKGGFVRKSLDDGVGVVKRRSLGGCQARMDANWGKVLLSWLDRGNKDGKDMRLINPLYLLRFFWAQ